MRAESWNARLSIVGAAMTSLIDFEGINRAALRDGRSFIRDLIPGGTFRSLDYVVKNPTRNDKNPGSFKINYKTGVWKDFASGDGGSDLISLLAYIRRISQGEAARELAEKLGVQLYKTNGAGPSKTKNGVNGHHNAAAPYSAPNVISGCDDPPPRQDDEIRRHVYRNSGAIAVRLKIKRADGSYTQRYRVEGGWQAKKPDDFEPVPYVTAGLNPFDPELKDDEIFWPEGEKDADTLDSINLPAFTFGGVGGARGGSNDRRYMAVR
jgi:hypothetical protein